MEEKITAKLNRMCIPYRINRILLIVFGLLMFLPDFTPVRFIEMADLNPISNLTSLFTAGISYESVIAGLEKSFDWGYIIEDYYILLFRMCNLILIGIIIAAIGGCMSVGNHRMKTVGNRFLLGGSIALAIGMGGVVASYFLITNSVDKDAIITTYPSGLTIFAVLAVLILISSVIIFFGTPKAPKDKPMEMETQYKLFLMLMPFLALVLAFSYMPLVSWKYAFLDYTAGAQEANFVGLQWFRSIVKDEVYVRKLLEVLRNTLVMSGLGIITSWVPMAFAIFLSEARSARFKRFVQVFTTIPNFISWVLVYAIAFAIFNTDGFVNTLIENITGNLVNIDYLAGDDFIWLKMLLWGMWKGVGWSAIIYISGIAGIDQQLYEAATVDGAGRFQKMWHVTLPGLLPTFIVMLVMSIAGILSNGMDQYLVFQNVDNQDYINVLDLYVYTLGISDGEIGLSTVFSMTKSIISVILLFVANKLSKLVRGDGVI